MSDSIEPLIAEWRAQVSQAPAVNGHDVDELETHLRDQINDLGAAGLTEDEAFLIAVKRLGDVDEMSREFAAEHSRRLWRQLPVVEGPEPVNGAEGLLPALGLAVLSAIAIQIPRILGFGPQTTETFYVHNAGLIVVGFLAWYFVRKNHLTVRQVLITAVPFVAGALAMNLYPWGPSSSTEMLAGIHLPVALWFVLAFPYTAGDWRSHDRRMDFVRFTGEWFIYYVLIALGGAVLVMLTTFILEPAGQDVIDLIVDWVIPSGAAGAVIIAAWLVEAKQSVVENMAPVLTMIFTPLFSVMLAISVVAYAVSGMWADFDRDAIFGLDVLLVVVLGLLLYSMSARESTQPPGLMDRIQLVAVISALALDLMVLSSMIGRISDLGFTPNRAAALGLNVVLLVNLVWAAWLLGRFIVDSLPFHRLERWQTGYLPVYALWTSVVVLVFPLLFAFD